MKTTMKTQWCVAVVCLACLILNSAGAVTLRVGHVGHDHQIALYMALDHASDYEATTGIQVKTVSDRTMYRLEQGNKVIADLQIVKVGGGSLMPTALAQGVIDIGFGGVAPVLACVDSGAPVKLVAPLHYKGDMFVVKPDFPAKSWQAFVAHAKKSSKPVRIGYKNPSAVAKLIFEEALTHEGLSFTGDLSDQKADVHMICTKGGGKLNVSLAGDLIHGYAGNNPFCAMAVEKKIGRILCDLEDLPPGTFKNHPCCCIAASKDALTKKRQALSALIKLCAASTDDINRNLDKSVQTASRWLGTSDTVERLSIPTSGYSMQPTKQWHHTMGQFIKAMNGLDLFRNELKGLSYDDVSNVAYDLKLVQQIQSR